jgi:hypothetical protein
MQTLTPKQRKRKYEKTAQWIKAHPEKIAQYDKKYLKSRAQANARRRKRVHNEAIEKLGGRCSSKTCRWINEDGSKGCTDFRILQLDHVKGGGTKHRKRVAFEAICNEVLRGKSKKFQLLCANCNWIKAIEQREFRCMYPLEKQP